jgi:hypothetical protein
MDRGEGEVKSIGKKEPSVSNAQWSCLTGSTLVKITLRNKWSRKIGYSIYLDTISTRLNVLPISKHSRQKPSASLSASK